MRGVHQPLRPRIVLASPGPGFLSALRSEAPGALAEHEGLRDRVSRQPVGAVRAADRLSGGVQPLDAGLHPVVDPDPAHMVVGDRRHLDGALGQVDPVLRQPVDDRAEGEP